MRHRHAISDEDFDRIKDLLPGRAGTPGHRAKDNRLFVDAVLWIAKTGAPWRDLPDRYGSWKTVASRFYRWRKAGIWERVLGALRRRADEAGKLDWGRHYVDSSTVRAHQHAAGAKGGTQR